MSVMNWVVIVEAVWLWWLVISNVRIRRALKRERAVVAADRAELVTEQARWLAGEREASVLPRLAKLTGMSELQVRAAADAAEAAAWEEFQNRTKGVQND